MIKYVDKILTGGQGEISRGLAPLLPAQRGVHPTSVFYNALLSKNIALIANDSAVISRKIALILNRLPVSDLKGKLLKMLY